MRARNTALAALALGILIGAGGCSSDSPTSPLAPSSVSAEKGGYLGSGNRTDSTSITTQSGYIGAGSRQESTTTTTASGGYIGAGS